MLGTAFLANVEIYKKMYLSENGSVASKCKIYIENEKCI